MRQPKACPQTLLVDHVDRCRNTVSRTIRRDDHDAGRYCLGEVGKQAPHPRRGAGATGPSSLKKRLAGAMSCAPSC